MIRYLGYPCINMNLSESTTDSFGKLIKISNKNKIFTSRTIRMDGFSLQKASGLALQNIKDLHTIMEWNAANNIHFFRISSNMFPFHDHPQLGYHIHHLPDAPEIIKMLKEVSSIALQFKIRLTCHPGPYTCIASPNPDVVSKSLISIERHSEIASILNTPDFAINIHVGGNYDRDYIKTADSFCKNFSKLSNYSKALVTLENDDKSNMWSVRQLYDYIYTRTGIPIVLDIHHWKFNHDNCLENDAELALSTWGKRIPKMHYSESRPDSKPQAHSDYIINKIPEFNGIYDVMIEAKQKEKALIKYRRSV